MTENSAFGTGKARSYDRAWPTTPPALLDLLTQWIGQPHPALVVDLGSGTGLSTAIWGERADRVIGIEPNAETREEAARRVEDHPYASQIEYREGVAHQTGLPDECADIVTCAQAFHWMEPTSTLSEIARILRPGGLFAAYDYDWPPTLNWELDRVNQKLGPHFVKLVEGNASAPTQKIWSKDGHLDRMRASNHFRFTREVLLHHIEQGDVARFLDTTMSNAFGYQSPQQSFALTLPGDVIQSLKSLPWFLSYRVRIGIK